MLYDVVLYVQGNASMYLKSLGLLDQFKIIAFCNGLFYILLQNTLIQLAFNFKCLIPF